jgi:hypothetical protein
MRKSDSGLSEVVSVVMILTVVILTIVLAALVIIPIMGDNEERVHNGDVLLEFASMKADVDTAWISNNTGVTRQAVFTLSPAGDRTEVTVVPNLFSVLSFGGVSLEYGDQVSDNYTKVNIIYTAANMYAEDIEIVYSGGDLLQNGDVILPGSTKGTTKYIVVVDKSVVKEQSIGGTGIVTLEYRLDKIVQDGNDYLCVFYMVIR